MTFSPICIVYSVSRSAFLNFSAYLDSLDGLNVNDSDDESDSGSGTAPPSVSAQIAPSASVAALTSNRQMNSLEAEDSIYPTFSPNVSPKFFLIV